MTVDGLLCLALILVFQVYHICDNGAHSVRTCDDELYFNPQTGLCDWPINVNCTAVNKKPQPTEDCKSIGHKILVLEKTFSYTWSTKRS